MPPYTTDQFLGDLMRLTGGGSAIPTWRMSSIRQSRPTVVWMRGPRGAMATHDGAPVLPRRRQAPLLGRPQRGSGRRRPRADPGSLRARGPAGCRRALRGQGNGAPARWARRDPWRDLPGPGRLLRGSDAVGDPGVGRVRGESGVAYALSWPRLGARARPRHAPQKHRRRDPHRARGGRSALRQLVRLPRGGLGRGLPAPFGDRRVGDMFQKHSYPLGNHRQRPRGAVRGRGCRLQELHVREVRTGDPPAAPASRIPDLRSEGRADPARGIPDPRGDQGRGGDDRGARSEARHRPARARPDGGRLQQGGCSGRASIPRCSTARARRASPRPSRTGRRPSTRRPSSATRSPAGSPSPSVACGSRRVPRCSTRRTGRSRDCSPRASWWAASSTRTTRWHGAHGWGRVRPARGRAGRGLRGRTR